MNEVMPGEKTSGNGNGLRHTVYEYDYVTEWDPVISSWRTSVSEYPEVIGHGHDMVSSFYATMVSLKTILDECYENGIEPAIPNRDRTNNREPE